MPKVFISHSYGDKYFVNLLVALLEFHEIEACCTSYSTQDGTRLLEDSNDNFKNVDVLMVVVSNNAVKSGLVEKEIAIFQKERHQGIMIPIILDSTDPCDLSDRLGRYRAIEFHQCMLKGFRDLFQLFNKEFLHHREKGKGKHLRSAKERRKIGELRRSGIILRMRAGFWDSYSNKTGFDKDEQLRVKEKEIIKAINFLETEARRYKYLAPNGRSIDPKHILQESANYVWKRIRKSNRYQFKAVELVQSIIDEILSRVQVIPIDRRVRDDRRKNDTRDEDRAIVTKELA